VSCPLKGLGKPARHLGSSLGSPCDDTEASAFGRSVCERPRYLERLAVIVLSIRWYLRFKFRFGAVGHRLYRNIAAFGLAAKPGLGVWAAEREVAAVVGKVSSVDGDGRKLPFLRAAEDAAASRDTAGMAEPPNGLIRNVLSVRQFNVRDYTQYKPSGNSCAWR